MTIKQKRPGHLSRARVYSEIYRLSSGDSVSYTPAFSLRSSSASLGAFWGT